MVLILLGMVILLTLTANVVGDSVRENLVVTVVLQEDTPTEEAKKLQQELCSKPYVNSIEYVSKEQALKEHVESMGIDPSEFLEANPFPISMEVSMKAEYSNNDSLLWIEKELEESRVRSTAPRNTSSSAMGHRIPMARSPQMLLAESNIISSIMLGRSAISVARLPAKMPKKVATMAVSAHPHFMLALLKVSGMRITFNPFQQTRIAMAHEAIMHGIIIETGIPPFGDIPRAIAITTVHTPVPI